MAEGEEGRAEALVLVLTTEANLERAEGLAEALLARGLVACVSLAPVISRYRWQGRATRSEEAQLLLKTHRPCLEALYQAVMELHSYDTPEWIVLEGHTRGPYGLWCAEQLANPDLKGDGGPPAPGGSTTGEGPAG